MKQWSILLVFLSLSLSLSAQQGYEKDVFVSSTGDSLPYRVIRPESMKAGKKYPLVLFLHGAGERGNDNERQLTHGGQMFLNPVNREKYPAFGLRNKVQRQIFQNTTEVNAVSENRGQCTVRQRDQSSEYSKTVPSIDQRTNLHKKRLLSTG